MKNQKLIVYSAELCSDCQALKAWMDARKLDYEIRDIRKDRVHAETLKAAIGKEAVPHLLWEGEWVRGYQVGKSFDADWAEALFESRAWIQERSKANWLQPHMPSRGLCTSDVVAPGTRWES